MKITFSELICFPVAFLSSEKLCNSVNFSSIWLLSVNTELLIFRAHAIFNYILTCYRIHYNFGFHFRVHHHIFFCICITTFTSWWLIWRAFAFILFLSYRRFDTVDDKQSKWSSVTNFNKLLKWTSFGKCLFASSTWIKSSLVSLQLIKIETKS